MTDQQLREIAIRYPWSFRELKKMHDILPDSEKENVELHVRNVIASALSVDAYVSLMEHPSKTPSVWDIILAEMAYPFK